MVRGDRRLPVQAMVALVRVDMVVRRLRGKRNVACAVHPPVATGG